MTWLSGLAGLLILAAVASDAFEVMLLPRRVRRQLRPVRYFFRLSWAGWSKIAIKIKKGRLRDGFLSLYGPLSMVLLLSIWSAGLIFGFGLLTWAVQADRTRSVFTSLYLSGATFFTLGYGDVVPKDPLAKALAVMESGSGMAFIAVTIGYLPVLYQLFSRREANVIQLDARAGSPPVACSLLCRHSDGEALDDLTMLLRTWEQWAAELVESHLSYPMLSYYRSQHDNQSWLAALTAILDSCALILTGLSGVRTFQARMTFALGRLAAIELCRVFHMKPLNSQNNRLDSESFLALEERLNNSDLTFSEPESAEERLASLRSTYEPFVHSLSKHFMLPLPPWSQEEDELDNWQRSRGGSRARRILDAAPVQPD